MIFGKKKKEELHKGDIFLAKGIYLKEPKLENGNVLLNCFLRSLIVFMVVLGSVGGFLSAFRISYNYPLVIIAYLLLSAYFSFLYALPKMIYRDLGYILFFGIFVYTIYRFRVYANSGFYVIVNQVLQYAQNFFQLTSVREYEVQIDNPYFTVAVVAVFLGMVEIIILNIWIYSTMSLGWTLLFTFPLLFIPIYMKQLPDSFYMILMCTAYVVVMVFKSNGHYLSFSWDASFRIRGLSKNRIAYTQDAGIFKQVLARALLFFFCVVILAGAVFPYGTFESKFQDDELRDKTSETIGNFILLGFGAFYNRYAATGGISGGKLGGVANVLADYQPDLLVSFAPYGNEAIYLKAYTGGIYGDNQWETIYGGRMEDSDIFMEESLRQEALNLQEQVRHGSEYGGVGRMDIKNVGADSAYLYYPYYTVMKDYSVYDHYSLMPSASGIGYQEETTYYYYPKLNWGTAGDIPAMEIDKGLVWDEFLDVPEKNAEIIQAECEKIGIQKEMTENEIVQKVRQYFAREIPYTLKPGATPKDEDFINYFLTRNRKGYCAHFASAATLLFRQMGIPARYVEGYAFSMEAVLASELNESKSYADYYTGYSEIGESAVVDVEVTDSMAHAWVEIYVPDFGWRVVEVTPGSNEATEENNFWDAFSDFWGNVDLNQNGNTGLFGNIELSKYGMLIYIVLGIFLVILIVRSCRLLYRKLRRYRSCHQENRQEALIARYGDICDIIRLYEAEFALCRNHGEQLHFIQEKYLVEFDVEKLRGMLECMSFSQNASLETEMDEIEELLSQFKKAIWKHTTLRQKIKWLGR